MTWPQEVTQWSPEAGLQGPLAPELESRPPPGSRGLLQELPAPGMP